MRKIKAFHEGDEIPEGAVFLYKKEEQDRSRPKIDFTTKNDGFLGLWSNDYRVTSYPYTKVTFYYEVNE